MEGELSHMMGEVAKDFEALREVWSKRDLSVEVKMAMIESITVPTTVLCKYEA